MLQFCCSRTGQNRLQTGTMVERYNAPENGEIIAHLCEKSVRLLETIKFQLKGYKEGQ